MIVGVALFSLSSTALIELVGLCIFVIGGRICPDISTRSSLISHRGKARTHPSSRKWKKLFIALSINLAASFLVFMLGRTGLYRIDGFYGNVYFFVSATICLSLLAYIARSTRG